MPRRIRHDAAAVTRRGFLRVVTRAGLSAAALSSLPAWTRRALAAASNVPADIIVRNDYPEHWETTAAALGRNWITSNDLFFVRSHLPTFRIDPKAYRLEVAGRVSKPLSLTLDELRALPAVTTAATLECAGNGRGRFLLPNTSGTQWELGAVGNAEWTGPRLATLLERAGVAAEAKHVWFECADGVASGKVPKFVRSIPIATAMSDALMAHTMNGAPLPRLHGAPLRAIVPGWFGMAWSKWVTRIRVENRPSDNHFMAKGYRYVVPGNDPATAPPVDELRVKSLITGAERASGTYAGWSVRGLAWAGPTGVRLVEISTDGGSTWRAARLTGRQDRFAWRSWEADTPGLGDLTVLARATDGAGVVQPMAATPNASGYGNNSIHRETFRAR